MNGIPLWWLAGVVLCTILAGRTVQPTRVTVCMVDTIFEGTTVTAEIWSDKIKEEFARYPGSYCGSCGKPRACPKR